MFEKKITNEEFEKMQEDRNYYKKLCNDKEKQLIQKDEDCERKLKQKDEDLASQKRILENELKVKIQEACRTKEIEISQLKENNGIQAKEIEVLTRAFENMGFDVKDMKDILNKLVDGIVSKNTVNIVK